MNCEETIQLLPAYIDKQLDVAHAIALEKHLSHCPVCNAKHAELNELQKAVRSALPYQHAPSALYDNIVATLGNQSDSGKLEKSSSYPHFFKIGLSFAASVLIGFVVVTTYLHHREEQQLIESILSSHMNALSSNQLTDVKGATAQDLAPWLNSRLDYSPRIYNLASAGFELLGARLDSIHKQRITALTYQHQHHLIDVYTWPSADVDDAVQEAHHKQGYNLVYWCKDNMNYWIVSDMEPSELQQFVKQIQLQQAGNAK